MRKMRKWGVAASALLLLSANVMADAAADAQAEAQDRISMVVSAIDVNDTAATAGFIPGHSYRLTWSIIGYEDEFDSNSLVLFDCTDSDNANYECGDKFADENKILVTTISDHAEDTTTWSYKASNGTSVTADKHTYAAEFVFPSTRQWVDNSGDDSENKGAWNDCGTNGEGVVPIVARFYQKETGIPSGATSISILIGARAVNSYGVYSRRVANKTCNP